MNTWEALDLDRLRKFGEDDTRDSESMVIRRNYERIKQVHQPRNCACGGTKEFRESVGAFKCPFCGAMETVAGRVL